MKNYLTHLIKIIWLLGLSFGPKTIFATPQVIRVDGSVYDATGAPLNGGSHSVIVNAYAAASGGAALWTSSTYTGVSPSAGRFTIDLDGSVGGASSLSLNAVATGATGSLWFEISFDGAIVRPRIRGRGTTFALTSSTTDGLRGVPISAVSPVTGNVLAYSGSSWAPAVVNAASVNALSRAGDTMSGVLNVGANVTATQTLTAATINATSLSASMPVLTNAAKALTSATGAVTPAQLGYLVNVTANIQTQITALQASTTTSALAVAAPLTISTGVALIGTTTTTISVTTASATTTGVLLSSDWNTFNNLAALSLTKIFKSGDTMTGPLKTPAVTVASAQIGALTPGQLVRTDASDNLGSVTTSVTDAQLAYLSGVHGGIQGQLNARQSVATSVQPIGMIHPFAGGRHGTATSGSNQITNLVGTTTLAVGQQIATATSILPSGTTITSIVDAHTVQVSASALSTVSTALFVIPPQGYLLCNGSPVSRTTYANLYGALGNGWGQGDGSTTFNLPDLRGRFLRGQNMGSSYDPDVAGRTATNSGGNTGDAVGSYQTAQYASHFHLLNDPGHAHGLSDPGHSHGVGDPTHAHTYYDRVSVGGDFGGSRWGIATTTSGLNAASPGLSTYGAGTGITFGAATSGLSLGATGGTETRPTNSDVNYVIKY